MNHLTAIGSFAIGADRGTPNRAWWLRTEASATSAWAINANGTWSSTGHSVATRGIRPALIIHQ